MEIKILFAFALIILMSPMVCAAQVSCDRFFGLKDLSEKERVKLLDKNELIEIIDKTPSTGYWLFKFAKKVDWDAELGVAVFTSFLEHKSPRLDGVKEVKIRKDLKQKVFVYYKIDSGFMVVKDPEYVTENFISKTELGFMHEWKLSEGIGLSQPKFIDGYLKVIPLNEKSSLLTYCNYSEPDFPIPLGKDMINGIALKRFRKTITQIDSWINEVRLNPNVKVAEKYRIKLLDRFKD